MMPTRRKHLKVRTSDVLTTRDMVRYIGYATYGTLPGGGTDRDLNNLVFTPETTAPMKNAYGRTLHRFSEGEFTYFRLPSGYTVAWLDMAVDRWRSFGVKDVEVVTR